MRVGWGVFLVILLKTRLILLKTTKISFWPSLARTKGKYRFNLQYSIVLLFFFNSLYSGCRIKLMSLLHVILEKYYRKPSHYSFFSTKNLVPFLHMPDNSDKIPLEQIQLSKHST